MVVKILKLLILERKHLLKSKVIFNEDFLNTMMEHLIQKKRLFTDKASWQNQTQKKNPNNLNQTWTNE
jgi:hypothetical protein